MSESPNISLFTLKQALAAHAKSPLRTPVRMMAAFSESADPAPADPPPTADQSSLFDLLHTDAAAPSSTAIAAVPPGPSADVIQELNDVMMLTSFISVASMRLLSQNQYKAGPPDITDPVAAAVFVKNVANAKNQVLTGSMGGYLSLNTASARSLSVSTTSADLHFEFLNTLFDGFNFPQSTLSELDAVLTSVTQTIGNLRLSFSDQSSTLDHMVFFNYYEEVAGLGVKIPKIRLYFLHIDQASWSVSVGKSSVQHFQFNMNFLDSVYDMDTQQTADDREKIKELLHTLTGQDLDNLNKLLSPKAVKDDRPSS